MAGVVVSEHIFIWGAFCFLCLAASRDAVLDGFPRFARTFAPLFRFSGRAFVSPIGRKSTSILYGGGRYGVQAWQVSSFVSAPITRCFKRCRASLLAPCAHGARMFVAYTGHITSRRCFLILGKFMRRLPAKYAIVVTYRGRSGAYRFPHIPWRLSSQW